MNTQQKIIVSWILLSLGVAIHNSIEVSESLFFKLLPEVPFNDGIPLAVHIIYIFAMIIPMVMAFLTLFYSGKGFKVFLLIYVTILALLNILHLIETIIASIANYSQVTLLLFVAIVNSILVSLIYKWKKEV